MFFWIVKRFFGFIGDKWEIVIFLAMSFYLAILFLVKEDNLRFEQSFMFFFGILFAKGKNLESKGSVKASVILTLAGLASLMVKQIPAIRGVLQLSFVLDLLVKKLFHLLLLNCQFW